MEYGRDMAGGDALMRAAAIVQGKWAVPVVYCLSEGMMRFSALRRRLPQVTEAGLTRQLRALEQCGLIHREVYPVVPPKVEYSLTEAGEAFLPILREMRGWAERYLPEEESR